MSRIEGDVETPTYEPTHDGLAAVRRFGYAVVHLVEIDALAFVPTKWVGPSYWALHDPAVTLCGALLRPDHRGLIAMRATRSGCPRCERVAKRRG